MNNVGSTYETCFLLVVMLNNSDVPNNLEGKLVFLLFRAIILTDWCCICKVRFIIMGNLFCTEYTIHRRFDLKGSVLGRTIDKHETEIDENTILKDLDLNFMFRLQKSWFQEFCRWECENIAPNSPTLFEIYRCFTVLPTYSWYERGGILIL